MCIDTMVFDFEISHFKKNVIMIYNHHWKIFWEIPYITLMFYLFYSLENNNKNSTFQWEGYKSHLDVFYSAQESKNDSIFSRITEKEEISLFITLFIVFFFNFYVIHNLVTAININHYLCLYHLCIYNLLKIILYFTIIFYKLKF